MAASDTTTTDGLFGGAVRLLQPSHGYRVNVDSILLAAFAAGGGRAHTAIDLGCGVGAVALGLLHFGAAARFELLERDSRLLELAERNAAQAGMVARAWCADVERGLPGELRQSADLVVCNPPFFSAAEARPSRKPERESARFGEVQPFLRAAAAAVRGPRAKISFVYPARALAHFTASAERAQLYAKRMRFVHPDAGSAARVALFELRRAKPGGLTVLPPLIEWSKTGVRSPELTRLLAGSAAPASDETEENVSVPPTTGDRR